MVAARIFDALNDPIMGNIIERTRTKWGKYKPWLTIGIALTCVVVYLAFNVQLQGWAFVVFFGVIYFCYSIAYTMHDISYWGMIPSLGSDGAVRDQFTSRATLFAGVGGTLAGILVPMLTTGSHTLGSCAQGVSPGSGPRSMHRVNTSESRFREEFPPTITCSGATPSISPKSLRISGMPRGWL